MGFAGSFGFSYSFIVVGTKGPCGVYSKGGQEATSLSYPNCVAHRGAPYYVGGKELGGTIG